VVNEREDEMTPEELEVLARDVAEGFAGNTDWWIDPDEATKDIAAFARSIVNDALEEAAVEIEKLERGVYTSAQTPAGLVRAMKVK
jgi:glycine/D-amino acid oxidase-like deaminating enzyme